MQIDFTNVDESESYVSVPPGEYLVRVAEVRTGTTRDGTPRWAFRLEVVDGPHAGHTAGWDSIVWSPRAMPRAKHVLSRFGYDVGEPFEMEAEHLVGRVVQAQFVVEEREDPDTGKRIARLRVPYLGYQRAAPEETPF